MRFENEATVKSFAALQLSVSLGFLFFVFFLTELLFIVKIFTSCLCRVREDTDWTF